MYCKSGSELVKDIYYDTYHKELEVDPKPHYDRSVNFWIGWAIAYYQWYSDRSFKNIFTAVMYEDLVNMYHPLHEADISKFVDVMDKRMKMYYLDTNLKRLRKLNKMSKKELSVQSGVSLRSIQLYEQRQKDINKASAKTLYKLSKVFSCQMEDLLEK